MNARHRSRAWLLGPLAIVVMTSIAAAGAGAAPDPIAGSQGTDTAIPATDSQVTVNGRDMLFGLAITVNQTRNLTNQAVSITWTGATPTRQGPGRFGGQYMQIMQCWGDDDGTNVTNPGPAPEQCEQGAVAGQFGGLGSSLYPAGFALSRVISRSDWENFDPAVGVLDKRTNNVWMPFRSVGGTTVDIQSDPTFNPAIRGGNFWLNPYFNTITTNEIAGAISSPEGKGAELFQVLTGVQSSGLGCGQRVQPITGGEKKVPKCWIVIVPRGTPTDENAGTPFETDADQNGVTTSPLSPEAWQHRIAIPIEFNPVDTPCTIGAEERRLAGTELGLAAVASWQPALCATGKLPPYSYATVSDGSARQQLVSGQSGAPGMVVVSRPLPASSVSATNPVIYAPLTASGLVIGFNIERNPLPDSPGSAQQLAGVRIADLNLTPRLAAKLLTQSYGRAVGIIVAPDYPWLASNPAHLGLDPDFLRFNPEFNQLQVSDGRAFSGLELPEGNSDSAKLIWEWILSDPEAQAWLAGAPDEWGMKVNPVYSTTAELNSTGSAFGTPAPSTFPKGDPYCYQAPSRGAGGTAGSSIVPPPLCGTDWIPYQRGLAGTAQVARAASDGARISANAFAQSASEVWTRVGPQSLGQRNMLALTDTPSAALFGLQMAHLSRAGDNRADRTFVTADTASISAGVAAMVAREQPAVLELDPAAVVPGAYPLTTLAYAAITPLSLEVKARSEYATFLDYAGGPGQVPGPELGKLPRGYVPLSEALRTQVADAAALVRNLVPVPDPATTSTTSTTVTASTSKPQSRPTTSRPTTTMPPSTVAPPTTQAPPTNDAAVPTSTTIDVADVSADSSPTVLTPIANLAKSRFAVPGLAVMALGSALGALEVTKRPRRRRRTGPSDGDLELDVPDES